MKQLEQTPDFRSETWPAWAQREFGIQFWAQYILRQLVATVRGQTKEFDEQDGSWAEPIYQRTFRRVRQAQR